MAEVKNLVTMPKILHKRFADYSLKEINEIKVQKCLKCEHFRGSCKNTKNSRGEPSYLNNATCEYLADVGEPRYCRPEICPYSQIGGGIQLNELTHEKFVNYEGYCKDCKYKDNLETDEPCDECLANPVNFESVKPIKFEKKENK